MGSGGSPGGRRSDGMAEGAQRLSFPGRTAVGAAGNALRAMAGVDKKKTELRR